MTDMCAIDSEAVSAHLHHQWGSGQVLAMSALAGVTDFAGGMIARTKLHPFALEFRVPHGGEVSFDGKAQEAEVGGDYFSIKMEADTVRGVFVDAYHLLIEGPCDVEAPEYVVSSDKGRTLIGVRERFEPALIQMDVEALVQERRDWVQGLSIPKMEDPKVAAALRKAILMTRTQVMSPEGEIRHRWSTPDRWPHQKMWLWDSVFHAIGWRHVDLRLACEMIDSVLDVQRPDGFVPHRASPFEASDITQPPVLAYGVLQLVEKGADLAWAQPLYPRLVAYLRWNERHRDSDGGGLLEWFIEDDQNCRSGESGMDNSPRFDEALQLDATDLNAFMAQEYRALSRLADRLGYTQDKAAHHDRWRVYCQRINDRLWNAKTGFYHDFDPAAGRQTSVLASSGFLPLFCGAADSVQARRLVNHLTDPQTFGTNLPVPSVARCSRRGEDKDMWRGPVWININWLVVQGLEDYGYTQEARWLRDKTCRALVDYHHQYGTFFEFYDDDNHLPPPELDRKGQNAPQISPYHQVIYEFGWSASLFIDWMYRDQLNLPTLDASCRATAKPEVARV